MKVTSDSVGAGRLKNPRRFSAAAIRSFRFR